MGFSGQQLADGAGVSVGESTNAFIETLGKSFSILGTSSKPTDEYKYLDGRCRHYKLIDEGHGTGPSHPVVQSVIREMVLGA